MNAVPKRPNETVKVTRSVVLDAEILALAMKAAKADNRSFSNYLNKIVGERLKRE